MAFKFSLKHRQKISLARKGQLIGENNPSKRPEVRQKISLSQKGKKHPHKGHIISKEHRKIISLANKKRIWSEKSRLKRAEATRGKKHLLKTRKKISNAHKLRVLEGKHHLWKGGVSKTNHLIRNSLEYRLWREAIFKRDNWTCVWCKKRGEKLNADHIKPFAYFPELRFSIDNGRTLCVDCHKKTDTYLRSCQHTTNGGNDAYTP